MTHVTPSGAFHAALCTLSYAMVFCFPETAGLSLKGVRVVFCSGFGVRESKQLRRVRMEKRLHKAEGRDRADGV